MVHIGPEETFVSKGENPSLDKDNEHNQDRHKKSGQKAVIGPEGQGLFLVFWTVWFYI